MTPRNKDFCMKWSLNCMMTNMKTVLFTDESRASPNDTDGLIKGWVFDDDGYSMEIRRQQSGLVIIIWGGII